MATLARIDSVKALLYTVYEDSIQYEELTSEEKQDMRRAVATMQRICNHRQMGKD